MRERRHPIEDLRLAIDCLPVRTRRAMLTGVERNPIIVGAYTDRGGGVCPMLAAHRNGGRTDFVSFAHAWDRFTGATRARRATPREVRILRAHLEMSLLAEERTELASAIAEHRDLVAKRRARRARPGDPDRSRELRRRGGWAWLRPFRRLDEFEAAVEAAYSASPGRSKMISGTTHAGEVLSR